MLSALAAATLFLSTPAPLEMPRAEAYLVKENGVMRLEDRYSAMGLWQSQTIVGRWLDDDYRVFTAARLESLPPALNNEETLTRVAFAETAVAPNRRKPEHLLRMVDALSPIPPEADYAVPRQLPRGLREVRYYQGTNTAAIICAYRLEDEDLWRYACWELAEGDDFAERLSVFEDEFLAKSVRTVGDDNSTSEQAKKPERNQKPTERELLREAARHSIAAYNNWHFTTSEEFVILDDLDTGRDFVTAVTNELPQLRRRWAEMFPSEIDGSNVLCVARIFRDRDDYLEAAGEEMRWSAAYWNPVRRELVACVPESGDLAELRRTFRHESFHQFLAYATSMIPVSPWLNEGYAQYFEDEEDDRLGMNVPAERWDELENALPGLMALDYGEFYAGTDEERRARYRLAKSIAVFLEKGAPKIRFEPFKDLKRNYLRNLFRYRNMRAATFESFRSLDEIKMFANEWKKFWMNR